MPKKISHDLNNLLASIGLSAELLLRQIPGPVTQKQEKYLKSILAEAKKMKALIKKLDV